MSEEYNKSRKVFSLLDTKDVRCKFCGRYSNFMKDIYNCQCDKAYKESHYYVTFKNNNVQNLYDYLTEIWDFDVEYILDKINEEIKER